MARKIREQALATRKRILDAAVEVFLEKGFQQSSLQNVAERAGVTRGAVYWHFRQRGDLLGALLKLVNATAADVYRYMNFDQIPAFVEVAETVEM